jgi:DNA polymerase-1
MQLANAKNIAVNSPVQGSAADLIKIAMIKLQNELNRSELNVKMVLQVHDELVFECQRSDLEPAMNLIQDVMEHAMDLSVPLKVDVGSGNNWLEAH